MINFRRGVGEGWEINRDLNFVSLVHCFPALTMVFTSLLFTETIMSDSVKYLIF